MLKGLNATGELPNEFADLTYLNYINLTRNFLYGSIPISWESLPLVTLGLSGNLINGTIPREMGNISTLEELLLSGNNFEGSLPETFRNLKNLTEFKIDGSSISGSIPGYIGNWTKLRWL
ncbi:hypothetical protein ACHQM5_008971 [Ranunculus cassubicifolius]